eukprot:comp19295_c1_seq1/m.22138 comp19295_c1_seq1/g.22138  ORF comp19295_c1_seq1/g.22138 comp19295_c1_seq1/m.22138 type:complete len:312 (-) comp19295_c1_seq1:185-1120(-)
MAALPAARLRELLRRQEGGPALAMPCCYDGLSAHLIEAAGFPLTFMSGFSVSASLLGLPDTGQASFREMVDTGFNICSRVSIPVIGDGDTGFGNAINVKRAVKAYARAGFAAIMIEDQVFPKRCGHTKGKAVVGREEAFARVRAACDARDEGPHDIVILARTDARGTHGLDEAIERCLQFREIGADMTFLEAPRTKEEMAEYCRRVPGPKLANMIEHGLTPLLSQKELGDMGYTVAAYPLTLLSACCRAINQSLQAIKAGGDPNMMMDPAANPILTFDEVKTIVGFDDYYKEEEKYAVTPQGGAADAPKSD